MVAERDQNGISGYNNQTLTVESESRISVPSTIDTYTNLLTFVLLLFFFMAATVKIVEGVFRSYSSFLNRNKLKEIDWELVLKNNRNTALIFIILLFSFVISYHAQIFHTILGREQLPQVVVFLIIFCVISIYILFRACALSLLDYVNKVSCFKEINRFYRNYLIVLLTFILVGEMFFYLVPMLEYKFITVWSIVGCIAVAAGYIAMATKVIFENKLSPFFYILYICALEVLPLALIIKLILLYD